ncbi:MAG: hypothetical protein R6T91_05465 [Bacteroidales bacterium]
MRAEQFHKMQMLEKVQHVLTNGVDVMSRIYMYYHIKLYVVDGFFVEIWYRQMASRIDYVEIVGVDDVFLNYKEKIDISDLYQKN